MSKKQKRVLWPTFAILSISVCAVVIARSRGAIATSNADSAPAVSAAEHNTAPSVAAPARSQVQNVRFTLYDVGIYPRQIRVGKGLVRISIEDLSGGSPGVVVERVTGNSHQNVGAVQRIQSHSRGQADLQLEPGTYEVHMTARPDNKSQLVVEP